MFPSEQKEESGFLSGIQRETVFRHNEKIRKEYVMLRAEVEDFLPEVISRKQNYTFSDLISCCMAVNQSTVSNILDMELA